jgi:acyl transferase domain-containing protein
VDSRDRLEDAPIEEIAIVGAAGRFPGAHDVDEFWRNLCAGVESVRPFSDEEMRRDHVSPADLAQPGIVKAGAVLDDVDQFDAAFFGIPRREAEVMDPQQRFFLECVWEALENAGCDPARYAGSIGVFGGSSANSYLLSNLLTRPDVIEQLGKYQVLLASDKDFLTTRVSYKLNLTGPSFTVQTACSTSLVAAHVACQSLLNGECDVALAGGASISVPHCAPYVYQEGGILAPDGHCRPFDADARGTVPGNGVAVVVLKRLSDAIADRDRIIAVIKGSAINNDGSAKVGFTAPGLQGQTKVLREALGVARVDPDSIGFIECHGTGTALGDPNELEALATAYGRDGAPGSCLIGSLKSNMGHLDAAAGAAGLIKAALSVEHGLVAPTVHFTSPTTRFDFTRSRFQVSSALTPWPETAGPRRASVSSFGIGGTNAHVVLEQGPEPRRDGSPGVVRLLPVSARTQAALVRAAGRLADALERDASLPLGDVAWTLQTGRQAFAYRIAVVADSREQAIAALRAAATAASVPPVQDAAPEIAFMFPGQGAQYVQMGADLYRRLPAFREIVDECAERLRGPLGGEDIRTLCWPSSGEETVRAAELMDQTQYTQPATFVIEYALARLLMSWGIAPQALIGHSVGEYAAACIAGVFSLADALSLIAARGRLIQSLPAGAMLAVFMSEEELSLRLPAGVTIAAVNARGQCVVAGAAGVVAPFERALVARGVSCTPLNTSHAFHSPMMDSILGAFRREVARVEPRPPSIPCVSNVTGSWLSDEEATDPEYWVRHLRQPVRFLDGLATVLKGVQGRVEDRGERVLVEVGPGRSLSGLARRSLDGGAAPAIVSSMRDSRDAQPDVDVLMSAVARLWTAGIAPDWEALNGPDLPYRVALPAYPFERQRYWIDPAIVQSHAGPAAPAAALEVSDRSLAATPRDTLFESAVQADIAGIWRELIGREDIRPSSNFFELGGDSLLATQLMSQIRARLGVELPLRAIFEAPSVAALAQLVDAGRIAGTECVEPDPAPSPAVFRTAEKGVDVDGLSDADVDTLLAQLLQEAST